MLDMLTPRLCPLSKPVSPEKRFVIIILIGKMPAKADCKVKQLFCYPYNNVKEKMGIASGYANCPSTSEAFGL